MNIEKSCGAIIIDNGKVLLVQQVTGKYGFPKGHMDGSETEVETAIREVKEETNLDIVVDSSKRYPISYKINENTLKEVVYFVASVKGPINLIKQDAEIVDVAWVLIDDVYDMLSFSDIKNIWSSVKEGL